MNKKYCSGCYNNVYNNGLGGSKECWSFKESAVVFRIPIGFWEKPPYKNKKCVRVASCFQGHGSNKIIYVKKERIDSNGYWN